MNCFKALCPFLSLMWELPEQQGMVMHKMTFPLCPCVSARKRRGGKFNPVWFSRSELSPIFPETYTSHFPNRGTAYGADEVSYILGFVLRQQTSQVPHGQGSVLHLSRTIYRDHSEENSSVHSACFSSKWWSCNAHQDLVSSLHQHAALPTHGHKSLSNCVQSHQATEPTVLQAVDLRGGLHRRKILRGAIPELKIWQRCALRRAGELFVLSCFTR